MTDSPVTKWVKQLYQDEFLKINSTNLLYFCGCTPISRFSNFSRFNVKEDVFAAHQRLATRYRGLKDSNDTAFHRFWHPNNEKLHLMLRHQHLLFKTVTFFIKYWLIKCSSGLIHIFWHWVSVATRKSKQCIRIMKQKTENGTQMTERT